MWETSLLRPSYTKDFIATVKCYTYYASSSLQMKARRILRALGKAILMLYGTASRSWIIQFDIVFIILTSFIITSVNSLSLRISHFLFSLEKKNNFCEKESKILPLQICVDPFSFRLFHSVFAHLLLNITGISWVKLFIAFTLSELGFFNDLVGLQKKITLRPKATVCLIWIYRH